MSSRKGQCQTEMSFYWHSWESGKSSARQRWAFIDLVESQERAVPDRDELLLTLLRVRKGQRQTERSFYWQSWESGKGSARQRWASGKGSARQRWAFIDRAENQERVVSDRDELQERAVPDRDELQERVVPDGDELLLTELRIRKGQWQTERSCYWSGKICSKDNSQRTENP